MTVTQAVVVDTSVARAASEPTAAGAALRAIEAGDLDVAMSPALLDEWYKKRSDTARPYCSALAQTWLAAMTAKGRLRPCNPDSTWLTDIIRCIEHDQARTALQKDVHVLALALAATGRLVTMDRALLALLRHLLDAAPGLCSLHWADPDKATVIDWLRAGAPDEASLTVAALLA